MSVWCPQPSMSRRALACLKLWMWRHFVCKITAATKKKPHPWCYDLCVILHPQTLCVCVDQNESELMRWLLLLRWGHVIIYYGNSRNKKNLPYERGKLLFCFKNLPYERGKLWFCFKNLPYERGKLWFCCLTFVSLLSSWRWTKMKTVRTESVGQCVVMLVQSQRQICTRSHLSRNGEEGACSH